MGSNDHGWDAIPGVHYSITGQCIGGLHDAACSAIDLLLPVVLFHDTRSFVVSTVSLCCESQIFACRLQNASSKTSVCAKLLAS